MPTPAELVDFRTELIQLAAVTVSAIEDMDYGEANAYRSVSVSDHIPQVHEVLAEIEKERLRQDEKWGHQHHRMADWLAIIGGEYGEACMAYVDDILIPTKIEQERIGLEPPIPVKWGLGPNIGL